MAHLGPVLSRVGPEYLAGVYLATGKAWLPLPHCTVGSVQPGSPMVQRQDEQRAEDGSREGAEMLTDADGEVLGADQWYSHMHREVLDTNPLTSLTVPRPRMSLPLPPSTLICS